MVTTSFDPDRARVRKMAAQLREVYKKYKVGILKEEDLTPRQRELLKRYYNVEEK